jgi:hypothetical protein
MNKNKVGLAVGLVLGGFHLFWALLIAVGLAQPLIDFIFNLHMIEPVIFVSDFSIWLTICLVVFTTLIGYIVGYTYACVWNYLHK